MARAFFRNNDRVTVHGWSMSDGIPAEGRVICVNRKSRYGETVVVLAEAEGSEHILFFTPEGGRYIKESSVSITLGWKP